MATLHQHHELIADHSKFPISDVQLLLTIDSSLILNDALHLRAVMLTALMVLASDVLLPASALPT